MIGTDTSKPLRLIVNADDYGFFDCVSRGILDAIRAGAVTATGIMANAPDLADRVEVLQAVNARFDVGVHLNLTLGKPLTSEMRRLLRRWGGRFPGKFAMAGSLLRRRVPRRVAEEEWRAQIENCLELGVRPLFLNSHEHVHMLPVLYPMIGELAETYGIPFIRYVSPDPPASISVRGVLRNLIVSGLTALTTPSHPRTPRLLGLGVSGKLTDDYLRRRLRPLSREQTYELMCHPGYFDPGEVTDQRLIAYHDWESELRLLTGLTFGALCRDHDIQLVTYRDLSADEREVRSRVLDGHPAPANTFGE